MPMVSKRVSASASGSASTTIAGRTKLWVTRPRRHRGRPKSAPWICRCAWTTLARRPQLHRANNSGRWFESDQEKERPSPYERTPAVLGLGSTADHIAREGSVKLRTDERLSCVAVKPTVHSALIAIDEPSMLLKRGRLAWSHPNCRCNGLLARRSEDEITRVKSQKSA